jgi:hypothetical protein
MSTEPELGRYLNISQASDNSTQASSKEAGKLIRTENTFYAGNYKENRTSIIFQAKEINHRKLFKHVSQDNELRTTGGLEDKFKKYSTHRNAFNKSIEIIT